MNLSSNNDMDTEKENGIENDTHNIETKNEDDAYEEMLGDSPPVKLLPPTNTVPDAEPDDEDEIQVTGDEDEGQETREATADHDGVQIRTGDDGPQATTSANAEDKGAELASQEEEEIITELPLDLSTVSDEVDQFISQINNISVEGGDGSQLPVDIPICVDQLASLVEAKLEEINRSVSKWSQLGEEETASLLGAVNRVSRLSKSLLLSSQINPSSEQTYARCISRVGGVLHRAVSYLEEEFRSYLEDYKFPDPADLPNQESPADLAGDDAAVEEVVEGCGSDTTTTTAVAEDNKFPAYPEETVSNLNRLARAMIFCGYKTECLQVYTISRRNALEECLRKVGFEKHSIDDVQKMNWEVVEREIVAWIATFKHCAEVTFSCERKLCDAVFCNCGDGGDDDGSSSSSSIIFGGLSMGFVLQFFVFPEAVAMTKRSSEKLFKFLDLYEAMRDLLPTMFSNIPGECIGELKAEATLTRGRLGEAMVSIFTELENSIKADSGKTPVPGGAVHPLTRYIMNYLKLASDYKETLEQVFREHQKIDRADSATGSDFDYNSSNSNSNSQQPLGHTAAATPRRQSPLEMQIAKVMELLDVNLENKSKLYKDPSLCSIFMMNNGRYILQKVRSSPQINALMGDQWCRKRSSDLRQYHKTYQRETWGRLLQCLSIEGLNVHGKINKPVLKERFKSFNAVFDEIHKTQTTWVIIDEQLQSELRVSISNMVIPAYRSFLARFSQTFTPGRQTEKYVKYQPEDIETYIDELFDGNAKK
ncbi:hypothetical protein DM860_016194 [Cuscuta australis]|uniref:Exocyst subunit Exo70 family protein n=1 Tax=Cuscuta australis TaxID=267555 RepID=A0A328DVC0_9ASTE|nr:hypothetical protein DM860_016194 [Cuscuta australis]